MSAIQIVHDGIGFTFDPGDEGDFIRRQIVQTNQFFEVRLLEYIRQTYPNHDRILDIGANFGNHTLFFAMFLGHSAIDCFEPCNPTCELLKSNVGQLATVHNIALGERDARGSGVFEEPNNAGTFTIREDPAGAVEIQTLDAFGFDDVTLMKIDAEWMELQVIRGGMQTIERTRPVIFAKGHGWGYMDPIIKLLAPLGYTCRNMFSVSGAGELGTSWELKPEGAPC